MAQAFPFTPNVVPSINARDQIIDWEGAATNFANAFVGMYRAKTERMQTERSLMLVQAQMQQMAQQNKLIEMQLKKADFDMKQTEGFITFLQEHGKDMTAGNFSIENPDAFFSMDATVRSSGNLSAIDYWEKNVADKVLNRKMELRDVDGQIRTYSIRDAWANPELKAKYSMMKPATRAGEITEEVQVTSQVKREARLADLMSYGNMTREQAETRDRDLGKLRTINEDLAISTMAGFDAVGAAAAWNTVDVSGKLFAQGEIAGKWEYVQAHFGKDKFAKDVDNSLNILLEKARSAPDSADKQAKISKIAAIQSNLGQLERGPIDFLQRAGGQAAALAGMNQAFWTAQSELTSLDRARGLLVKGTPEAVAEATRIMNGVYATLLVESPLEKLQRGAAVGRVVKGVVQEVIGNDERAITPITFR